MKYQTIGKLTILLSIILFLTVQLGSGNTVKASDTASKYGIVIADQKGNYTFYDLNGSAGGFIETSAYGDVMVPLKQLVKRIPGFTYQYNTAKKAATVTNTGNGKKIIYIKGSKYLTYYSNAAAKGVKKKMKYSVYVSESSSAVMVQMSSIQWLFQTADGFKYYAADSMQTAGYDTYDYCGLILYNPYNFVKSIPKATGVAGISKTIKVTIPEGYSIPQIFNLLVEKGVCASKDYLYNAMENDDFTEVCPLLINLPASENRCYKLEGYLYPDTYEFYRLSSGHNALAKMLENTDAKLTQEYKDKAEQMGFNMDQILTVASLIEKETGDSKVMPKISSVIYNRLSSGMELGLLASKKYLERYVHPYISGDVNRYDAYYNTLTGCKALPAGPVCNPGITAIKAALNPETSDNLYFFSDSEGVYHFSHDYVNPNTVENTDNAGNQE